MSETKQVAVRCTAEELADLDARVEASGLSRQMYVYALLWGEPPQNVAVREVARQRESLVGPSEPEERPQGTPRARPAPPPVGPAVSKPRKKTGLVTEPAERTFHLTEQAERARQDIPTFFKKD